MKQVPPPPYPPSPPPTHHIIFNFSFFLKANLNVKRKMGLQDMKQPIYSIRVRSCARYSFLKRKKNIIKEKKKMEWGFSRENLDLKGKKILTANSFLNRVGSFWVEELAESARSFRALLWWTRYFINYGPQLALHERSFGIR